MRYTSVQVLVFMLRSEPVLPFIFQHCFFSLIIWRPHIQLQCCVFVPNFKNLLAVCRPAFGNSCYAGYPETEMKICAADTAHLSTGFHGFSLWNKRPRQPTRMSYTSIFYLTQQCQAYNVPFISIVYFNTYQEDRKLVINVEGSMRFHYKLM